MDDPFLWSHPSQLAVAGELTPERSHVSNDILERTSLYIGSKSLDPRNAEFVATADRKGESVSGEASRVIGFKNRIGRGVIRVRIHSIGPIEEFGRGKPEVVGL